MTLLHPLPDDLIELIARWFRAMAEPSRIRLLDQLRDGEETVNELAARLGAGQQNVSKHLCVLTDAGILARRKDGNHIYYRIADDRAIGLCEQVCGSVEQQVETLALLVAGAAPAWEAEVFTNMSTLDRFHIDSRGRRPLSH